MTDFWNKGADPSKMEPHYGNAVDLLTRHEVFEKSDVAVVIAFHAREIERLRAALTEIAQSDPQIRFETIKALCDAVLA